jgi:hypothetical protein
MSSFKSATESLVAPKESSTEITRLLSLRVPLAGHPERRLQAAALIQTPAAA